MNGCVCVDSMHIVILILFKVYYQYTGIYRVQLRCILPYSGIGVIYVRKYSVYEGLIGDDYAGADDCIMAIASLNSFTKDKVQSNFEGDIMNNREGVAV